jgi:hypothetical protein
METLFPPPVESASMLQTADSFVLNRTASNETEIDQTDRTNNHIPVRVVKTLTKFDVPPPTSDPTTEFSIESTDVITSDHVIDPILDSSGTKEVSDPSEPSEPSSPSSNTENLSEISIAITAASSTALEPSALSSENLSGNLSETIPSPNPNPNSNSKPEEPSAAMQSINSANITSTSIIPSNTDKNPETPETIQKNRQLQQQVLLQERLEAAKEWNVSDLETKLNDNSVLLTQWNNILDKNENMTPSCISVEDIKEHMTLRRGLHESLGFLAKYVQMQMQLSPANFNLQRMAITEATAGVTAISKVSVEATLQKNQLKQKEKEAKKKDLKKNNDIVMKKSDDVPPSNSPNDSFNLGQISSISSGMNSTGMFFYRSLFCMTRML